MKISWLKTEDGKDWSVRIEGEPMDSSQSASLEWTRSELTRPDAAHASRLSLVYHFGLEGLGDIELDTEPDEEVPVLALTGTEMI